MKTQLISLIIFTTMIIVACSPMAVTEDVSRPVTEEVSDTAVKDAVEESNKGVKVEGCSEITFSSDIWLVIRKYALNAHGGKDGVFLES